MNSVKLSVCMITYNHQDYIAQALDGVVAQQTDFDYEVVIGEDCSQDHTREIIAEYHTRYPDRMRPIFREKNIGMIENFVRTIQACRGQYIALVEGDDFWTSPHKLQMQADFLDSHPECSGCYHNVSILEEGNSEQGRLFYSKPPKSFLYLDDLVKGNTIHTCSMVYRAGLFEEFPEWYYSMPMGDWPLYVMNARKGPVGYIDGVLATYRVHRNGLWSTLSLIDNYRKSIFAAKTLFYGLDLPCGDIIEKQIAIWQYELARLLFDQQDYRGARQNARDCMGVFWFGGSRYRKALRFYLKSIRKDLKATLKSKWRNIAGRQLL